METEILKLTLPEDGVPRLQCDDPEAAIWLLSGYIVGQLQKRNTYPLNVLLGLVATTLSSESNGKLLEDFIRELRTHTRNIREQMRKAAENEPKLS